MNTAIANITELDSYMSYVFSIPILTHDEERELAKRYIEDADEDAAKKMILSHLRLVVTIAHKFKNYGLPLEDLIQEGNLGLMAAIQKFDPDKGRFSSFATYYINYQIYEYVINHWKIVKVATTKPQRKLFFNLRSMRKSYTESSEAERKDIAQELNVTIDDVRTMEARMYCHHPSYDNTNTDPELIDSSPSSYLHEEGNNPAAICEEGDYQEFVKERLFEAIDSLPERERGIILARKLAENPATLGELSEKYNISAERVRQLENAALKRLKSAMEQHCPSFH